MTSHFPNLSPICFLFVHSFEISISLSRFILLCSPADSHTAFYHPTHSMWIFNINYVRNKESERHSAWKRALCPFVPHQPLSTHHSNSTLIPFYSSHIPTHLQLISKHGTSQYITQFPIILHHNKTVTFVQHNFSFVLVCSNWFVTICFINNTLQYSFDCRSG